MSKFFWPFFYHIVASAVLSILLGIIKIIGWRFSAPSFSLNISSFCCFGRNLTNDIFMMRNFVKPNRISVKISFRALFIYRDFPFSLLLWGFLSIFTTSSEYPPSKSITMLTFHPADVCPQFRLHHCLLFFSP